VGAQSSKECICNLDSGILSGILGGLADAAVNLADLVMAGSVLKNAWKKF